MPKPRNKKTAPKKTPAKVRRIKVFHVKISEDLFFGHEQMLTLDKYFSEDNADYCLFKGGSPFLFFLKFSLRPKVNMDSTQRIFIRF